MSDQTLERSVLEKKDRDELLSIVDALGAKAPSRARKAELVDLILETTGVGEANGSSANGDVPTAKSDVDEKPKKTKKPTAKGESTGVDDAADDTGDDARDDRAADSSTAPVSTDAGEVDVEESGDGQGRGGGNHPDRERDRQTDRTKGNQNRNRDRQGSQNKGGQNKGGQDKGGQDKGGGDGDEQRADRERQQALKDDPNAIKITVAEAGNRRGSNRRRRGRGGQQQGGGQTELWAGEPTAVEGILDLHAQGYGFLRVKGFLAHKDDVYVSQRQARQFHMRKGDHVTGVGREALRDETNPALLRVETVNGAPADEAEHRRPNFEDLTPLFPDEKLPLEREDDPTNMTARIVDLISPIGKGQRGLIVSPPKAGKTTIMKQIAHSIERNNPEVHLMVLLVDERPEEVTDMRRSTNGEVIASTFDRPSEEHTQVAELAIERAKRLVETGRDVVIILDGITRLSRAYNLAAPATGRIMSGGVDSGALYPPKKFFGAARNLEEGGSLTILATALVETGSKMDEVIFEEFKGTGNMELRLDRRLSERRIYPAIDVDASSTRHEELLFDRKQLQQVWKLRRVLSGLANDAGGGNAGLELLIDRMKTFKSNDEFLAEIAKTAGA